MREILDTNVLLVGCGRMGRIHSKYLRKLGINFSIYDPFNTTSSGNEFLKADSLGHVNLLDFTHAIIASPDHVHIDNYTELRNLGFGGEILIEKPAFISKENLKILESDKKLCVGLVERYNPTIESLKSKIQIDEIISLDFIRCSHVHGSNQSVSAFRDVGIHDLDIYDFILGINKDDTFELFKNSNTFNGTLKRSDGIFTRFLWSNETFLKERKITVRQSNSTYIADLMEQSVHAVKSDTVGRKIIEQVYVEKASPIERQLVSFLKNENKNVGIDAHVLVLENI